MSFLGVDVGTQSCKAVLFDEYGSILGESHAAYELITKGEYVEIPPDLLLSAVRKTIFKLTHDCAGGKIETISFSVLGEAVTPLGKEMSFLGNTVPALDTRSARICEDLKRRRGFRYFYGITGQSIHPMFTLGKILWWKENEPDLFTATKKFLCWEEIIHYEFCHRCCIDYSLAARTMLFDIRKKRWSEEMLGIAGLEEPKLGEVVGPGEILGTVDRRLANELGLPKETLVVAGGFDQACAALGASVLGPGVLLDNIGTTHCIGAASPSFDLDGKVLGEGFSTVCHVVPGMYFSLGGSHSGGINVKWYLEKLCGQKT
jgi:xylulokinase